MHSEVDTVDEPTEEQEATTEESAELESAKEFDTALRGYFNDILQDGEVFWITGTCHPPASTQAKWISPGKKRRPSKVRKPKYCPHCHEAL